MAETINYLQIMNNASNLNTVESAASFDPKKAGHFLKNDTQKDLQLNSGESMSEIHGTIAMDNMRGIDNVSLDEESGNHSKRS
jgi:hypothetical protein